MKNKYMNESELNVAVGDYVSVQGHRGHVIDIYHGFDVEWNGKEYVKIPDSDFTNVQVHFEGELSKWGQYQNGWYGDYYVIEK